MKMSPVNQNTKSTAKQQVMWLGHQRGLVAVQNNALLIENVCDLWPLQIQDAWPVWTAEGNNFSKVIGWKSNFSFCPTPKKALYGSLG